MRPLTASQPPAPASPAPWPAGFLWSQSALRLYDECPLRFRRRYLDGLIWDRSLPAAEAAELDQGTLFHLEAERLYRGLPVGPGGRSPDPERQRWLENLARFRPPTGARLLPEARLVATVAGAALEATLDLVEIADGRLTIYDWKTHRRGSLRRERLEGDWKTVVYLAVAARAGHLLTGGAAPPTPESLQMVYFNPRDSEEPVIIAYSREREQAATGRLAAAIAAIGSAASRYAGGETGAFPATADSRRCLRCPYQGLCRAQGHLAAATAP